MGRSRGGLTSKLHALVDADGRPVGLRLTGGQVHDACEAEALIEAIPEGATLLGDKGYDSNAIRQAAAARNVWANISNRSNRIKQFRGIATRYDKDPANFLAAIKLICVRIWCSA
jgi:transposase